MEKIKLTKREYIGEGNYHTFKNKKTQNEVIVWCSDEEYKNLSLPNSTPPILDGHDWISSSGGAFKVNSFTGLLEEKEFFINNNYYYVFGEMEALNEEEFNSKYICQ